MNGTDKGKVIVRCEVITASQVMEVFEEARVASGSRAVLSGLEEGPYAYLMGLYEVAHGRVVDSRSVYKLQGSSDGWAWWSASQLKWFISLHEEDISTEAAVLRISTSSMALPNIPNTLPEGLRWQVRRDVIESCTCFCSR